MWGGVRWAQVRWGEGGGMPRRNHSRTAIGERGRSLVVVGERRAEGCGVKCAEGWGEVRDEAMQAPRTLYRDEVLHHRDWKVVGSWRFVAGLSLYVVGRWRVEGAGAEGGGLRREVCGEVC